MCDQVIIMVHQCFAKAGQHGWYVVQVPLAVAYVMYAQYRVCLFSAVHAWSVWWAACACMFGAGLMAVARFVLMSWRTSTPVGATNQHLGPQI